MSNSVKSSLSKSSQMTQQIFDDVTEKQSRIKMIQQQGIVDPDILEKSWVGFGIYISKQLRTGRAVSVPKFGLFTFSAPEVTLKGTTNPEEREPEKREPVFKIYQEIGKGMQIKPAVFKDKGLRPLTVSSTSGKIQTVIISYADIAVQQNIDKDTVKLAVERVLKQFDENIRQGQEINLLEIPCVGTIIVKKGLGGLAFNEFLKKDTIGLLKKNIQERKKNMQSQLTSKNINKLIGIQEDNLGEQEIDEDAQNWLSENLDIQFEADNYEKSVSKRSGQKSLIKIKNNNNKQNSQNKYSSNPLLDTKSNLNEYKKMSVAHREDEKSEQNQNQFTVENQTLKKIRIKLQINEMPPEESFLNLCTGIYGINANQQSLLHKEQLGLALQKQQCDLYDYELDAVFKVIDIKKDQVIDLSEWTQIVCEEKTPQQFLMGVLKQYGNDIQKIKEILKIAQEAQPVSSENLIKGLKSLNPNWSIKDLKRIKNFIMRGNNKITSEDLINLFQQKNLKDVPFKDDDYMEKQWHNLVLKKIKRDLENQENPNFLLQKFQSFDDKMEGIIDIANFKTCLMQSKLESLQDPKVFQQFVKGIELDSRQMLNYTDFINSIKSSDVKMEHRGGLEYIAEKIKMVLKDKRLDCKDFFIFLTENQDLRRKFNIENRHSLKKEIFSQLLAIQVFPQFKKQDVLKYAYIIDVDKDGFIDQYDLQTFLGRYGYFESVYLKNDFQKQNNNLERENLENSKQSSNAASQSFKSQNQSLAQSPKNSEKNNNNISIQNQNQNQKDSIIESQNEKTNNSNNKNNGFLDSKLFPTETLSEEKLLILIKEMKRIAIHNKQNWFEIFQMMDVNNNGFVTIAEFSKGIDKLIKLSKVAKEGLFAYFDNLKIGMFDFMRFKEVMCRIDSNLYANKFEDNWNWQTEIIEKWRNWYKQQKISIDEAFRLADFDFDGFLSQQDIQKFLVKFLKIREQEIDNVKLQRLFQLCDKLKRGVVQKTDLQTLLEEEYSQNLEQIKENTLSEKSINEHHRQWLESAKLQIAMFILKNFKSIDESFEKISKHSSQILFKQFKDWLEGSLVLKGYNLTDALIQTLFSNLDPHKKGILSKSDWCKAFGNVNQKTVIALNDILKCVYSNFDNFNDTFVYFCDKESGKIGFQQFKRSVKSLFLEIYDLKQISEIWNLICKKLKIKQDFKSEIGKEQFQELFQENKFKNSKNKNKQQQQFQISQSYLSRSQYGNNWGSLQSQSQRNSSKDLSLNNKSLQMQGNEMPSINSMKKQNSQHSERSLSQTKLFNSTKMFLSQITSPMQSLSRFSKSSLQNNNNKFKSFQHFETTQDIYTQLNKLLIASGKNIKFAFQEVDKLNTGNISTMEFKHILMTLNLGLTRKEIETIIMLNSFNGDQIKWKEFLDKLKQSESEQQLENRSQNRILELRHDLYTFLISPKDAFRQFDQEKKGKMSFSEFREFLIYLYSKSQKIVPPYAVAKDMFDFIDIKNDGIVDIEEWVQAFARYDNYGGSQNLNSNVRNIVNQNKLKKLEDSKKKMEDLSKHLQKFSLLEHRFDKPIYKNNKNDNYNTMSHGDHFKNTTGLPLKWERTLQYDQAIRLIGKNRRILADDFKEAGGEGEKMLLHKFRVQAILDRCLKHYNIQVQPQNWEVITHFAQEKDQMINCKFLLEVYKQRLMDYDSQPHNIKKFEDSKNSISNINNRYKNEQ